MELIRHVEYKTEQKLYNKFPAVRLLIERGIDHIKGKSFSNRRVCVADGYSQTQFDAVIQDWYKSNKVELPYSVDTEIDLMPKALPVRKNEIDAEDLELGESVED